MFRISQLQLRIRLLDDNAPAGFWGSRLRGGYGRVLKEYLCDHKHLETCLSCDRFQNRSCDYPQLFEPIRTEPESRKADHPLRNQTSLPRPFVIDLPRLITTETISRKRLRFGFTFIGPLCQRIEYPITAFSLFGQNGIEVRGGTNARFLLEDARDRLGGMQSIFRDGEIGGVVCRDISDVIRDKTDERIPSEIVIRFITPVRVEQGAFRDFYAIVFQLCLRIGGLWQLYGSNWPGQKGYFQWRESLLKASREVKLIHSDLRNYTTARFSHRQNKKLPLYGFIGTMRFSGDFTPFEELLRVGEIVHIGQQTAFGLGRYQILEELKPTDLRGHLEI